MKQNGILKLLGLMGVEPIEEDDDSVLPSDDREDWEELPPYIRESADAADTPAYLYEEDYDPEELAELEAEDETAVYAADAPDNFYLEEYTEEEYADGTDYYAVEIPEEFEDTRKPAFGEKLRGIFSAVGGFFAGLAAAVRAKLQSSTPVPQKREEYYTNEFGSSFADDFSAEVSDELVPEETEHNVRSLRVLGGDRRTQPLPKPQKREIPEETDPENADELVDDLLGDSVLDDLLVDQPPVAAPQTRKALVRQTFRTAVQPAQQEEEKPADEPIGEPAAEEPAEVGEGEENLHPRRAAFRPKFFYSADEVEEFRKEKEEQAAAVTEEPAAEETVTEEEIPAAVEEIAEEELVEETPVEETAEPEEEYEAEEIPEEEPEEAYEEEPAPQAPETLSARNHGVVVALGMFDGVHAGHQHLLSMARKDADQLGLPLHVVTFYEHPSSVLTGKPVPYLTTLEDRIGLLTQYGMDCLNIYHFTPRFASMHYRDFIRMLVQELDMTHIVLGQDAVFGRGGQGNPRVLMREAENFGISVHVVPDVTANGMRVSSSNIRMAAANGEIAFANACLTRPYTLAGVIVPGAQRGALLGYPTANLRPGAGMLVPANGVYFSQILLPDGVVRNSITNIGVHPTVDELELPIIETHILDYEGDCYGQPAHVALLQMLRPEQKFDTFAELSGQIARDTRTAREFFAQIGL